MDVDMCISAELLYTILFFSDFNCGYFVF